MKTKFQLTERNYHYLFDNASDAMWVHNLEGTIVVANKACEKLTGYAMDELIGMNVTRFLAGEFLETAREVKRKLLEGTVLEQPYEQRLLRKDGTTGTVMMTTSLLVVGNEVKGFQHIARDVTEEKQMQENMRYYVQQITKAQEEERKRIARELHDDMAPFLILLLQRLDNITSRHKPKISDALKEELMGVRKQAVEALESLRRCAQDLRPRILDDLGLTPALEWAAEKTEQAYGINVQVEIIGKEGALSPEVQILLFRIVQEALINIRKHARASQAVVRMEFEDDKVRVTVSDNGQGFVVPAKTESLASNGKLGIMGMMERARLLNGSLRIESALGKGTEVIAEIPIKK